MVWHDRAAVGVAAAAAIAMYVRTLGYEPVFDDLALLDEHGPLALGGGVPYRPLRYLSYWLDSFLGGGAAWAYHATNVLLHAVVAALSVVIGRSLGLGGAAAVLAGVCVAVHPLGVESVAYIAGRRDLLAAFFGLVSVLFWLDERRHPLWVLVLLPLAAAAKESGLVFAVVCLAASWSGVARRPTRESGTVVIGALVCVALIFVYGGGAAFVPVQTRAFVTRAPELAWHYASGLTLLRPFSADYPEFVMPSGTGVLDRVVGLIACVAGFVAIATAAERMRRSRDQVLAFAIAWFGLVAASIVFAGGFHEPGADRHAYPLLLPSALVCALAFERVAAVDRRGRHVGITRVAAAIVLSCLLVGLAFRTWAHTPVWENELVLWTNTLSVRPASARAHQNLASIYVESGRRRKARLHLKAALNVRPDYAPAHLGHAYLSCSRGNANAAHPHLVLAASLGSPAGRIAEIRSICAANATLQSKRKRGTDGG